LDLKKIIKEKFPKIEGKQKIIVILIVTAIFFPMITNMVEGHEVVKSYYRDFKTRETLEIIEVNDRIKENISPEKIIASNYPAEVWFRTGLNSISLPYYGFNQENFEKYIDYFNISYLVFYEKHPQSNAKIAYEKIINFSPLNYTYKVQIIGGSSIIAVKDILEADISNPLFYVEKMQRLEKLERISDAKMVYNELRDFDSDDNITEKICEAFTIYHLYEDSIYKCSKILKKDSNNLIALQNLLISYDGVGEKENVYEILKRYAKLEGYVITELEIDYALFTYDLTIKKYQNEIKWLRDTNQVYEANDKEKSLINIMFGKAALLTSLDEVHQAHRVYLKMLGIDKFNPTVYKKIAEYYEKNGPLLQAIHNYELASMFEPENDYLIEKIEELKKKVDE